MTAQVHEKLILNGKNTSMACCPPIPNDSRIMISNDGLFMDHNKFLGDLVLYSTACWRRYIGTWEIKNAKFYLVQIRGQYNLSSNTPIFADWFSGTLIVPKGKMLHYEHIGFASIFEQELHILIDKGLVVNSKRFCNYRKKPSAESLTEKIRRFLKINS